MPKNFIIIYHGVMDFGLYEGMQVYPVLLPGETRRAGIGNEICNGSWPFREQKGHWLSQDLRSFFGEFPVFAGVPIGTCD